MTERAYYLGFSLFDGIGPKRFAKLLGTFGTAKAAWEAEEHLFAAVLGPVIAEQFATFKKTFSFTKIQKQLKAKEIVVLIPVDKDYPALLKTVPVHPYVLYAKGNIHVLNYSQAIGIVGTRKITSYGRQVTEQLTRDLVHNNFVTVSGLAMGVDAKVHTTTMDAGGKTIAVLGCGVDCCSPLENQQIYDRILKTGGAIVSTFPPSMGATKGSFPARNAIIAGLSQGVVVTEGAADSGALITAEDAKKIDRPVFAVPGPITSGLSKGPNVLLQNGAVLITGAEDIMRVLPSLSDSSKKILHVVQDDKNIIRGASPEEQKILDMIQLCPLQFDEIVRTIGKSAKEVGSLLSLMEVKGMIKNNNGAYSVSIFV